MKNKDGELELSVLKDSSDLSGYLLNSECPILNKAILKVNANKVVSQISDFLVFLLIWNNLLNSAPKIQTH